MVFIGLHGQLRIKWCLQWSSLSNLGVHSFPVLLQCVDVWCVKAPGTLRAGLSEGAEFSHGGVAVGRDLWSPQSIRAQTNTHVFPTSFCFVHVIKSSTGVLLTSNSGHYKGIPRFVFTATEKNRPHQSKHTAGRKVQGCTKHVNHRNEELGSAGASGNVISAFSTVRN